MQTLLLLLLSGVASAHMPVFGDDLLGKNVIDKSWAVYETMKAGDNLLLRLNISVGENFSISVNMPGSQDFKEGVEYVNVTVTGHNAESIDCDPAFNGWRVLSGTHARGLLMKQKLSRPPQSASHYTLNHSGWATTGNSPLVRATSV